MTITRPNPVSVGRRVKSAGNVMVESAFTLLPTFALIFALADFGLMIFRWATLQNAVREATRYAVTFQTVSGLGQDASIKRVVEQYGMGFVKSTDNPQHIFVRYYAPTDLSVAITSGGNVPNNLVEVSVENLAFDWIAPLSGSFGGGVPMYRSRTALTLNLRSSDVLGGYPVGVLSVNR